MRWLPKFWILNTAEKRLLVEAALLVGGIRLGLWVLPFRTMRLLVFRLGAPSRSARPTPLSPDRLAWAVAAAARRVPAASCLTQAMALHLLCRRNGYPTQLQIGVTRRAGGAFCAHAWVERDGKILIGNLTELATFLPLPSVGF